MALQFFSKNSSFRIKSKISIKKWIELAVKKEKRSVGEITYIFCSDKYLLEINKKYLKHNYFTDIITFQYYPKVSSLKSQISNLIFGDIFISIDRVKVNAKDYDVPFDHELKRVMIHGILHLLGYKDKTKSAKGEMTKREDFYLHLLSKKKSKK